MAAASLIATLQRLQDPLPAGMEAAVATAVAVAAHDYGGGIMRLPGRSIGVVQSCLDVAGRLLVRNPGATDALCGGDAAVQTRLLDRWTVLSSARDVGEIFVPSLGAAGRLRRHNSAVALCSIMYADVSPALREVHRAAQVLVLGLKAVREAPLYVADQQRLADLSPTDPVHEDQLMLRRLQLARVDPLRSVDATAAVQAAASRVMGYLGEQAVMAAVEEIDPLHREQLGRLLHGGGDELPQQHALQYVGYP
jgi:hypothetical protein